MSVGHEVLWKWLLASLLVYLAQHPVGGQTAAPASSVEPSPPAGYGWNGPEPVTSFDGVATDAHLAGDDEGTVHVVWIAEAKSIHYRALTRGGWQEAELVEESGTRSIKPAAVRLAARRGALWMVHRRDVSSGRSRVIAMQHTSEGWSDRERLCDTRRTLVPPVVHIDGDDQVQVYWFVQLRPSKIMRHVQHELYTRRLGPEGWSEETRVLAPTVNIRTPCICFDQQDQAHVAWFTWFREAMTGVGREITRSHHGFAHQVTGGRADSLRPPKTWPFLIMEPDKTTMAAAIDGAGHWHGLVRAHPRVVGEQEDHFFYVTNRSGAWPSEVTPIVTRPFRSTGALLAASLNEGRVLLAWQEGASLHGFVVQDGQRSAEWDVPIEGDVVAWVGSPQGIFHLLTSQLEVTRPRWHKTTTLFYYSLSPTDTTEQGSPGDTTQ